LLLLLSLTGVAAASRPQVALAYPLGNVRNPSFSGAPDSDLENPDRGNHPGHVQRPNGDGKAKQLLIAIGGSQGDSGKGSRIEEAFDVAAARIARGISRGSRAGRAVRALAA
jgi:hypothetical protein